MSGGILLTAFSGERNASKVLLDGVKVPRVCKLLLTNSFDGCAKELTGAIFDMRPKYVLAFGQKPDADCIYIETAARGQDGSISTGFNVDILRKSLEAAGILCRTSDDAGRYLCNHVYFTGLDLIRRMRMSTEMVFVHVPGMKRFHDIDKTSAWLWEYLDRLE